MFKIPRTNRRFDPMLRLPALASETLASHSLQPQLHVESLEERSLLSAVFPTNYEQYMLELINRARANPVAYAASLGIDLNEGLAANTISAAAKQPLAINPYLTDAAASHSQWMLDGDMFSHSGASGSSPTQRMQAAGYVLTGSWATGENIGYQGTTGTPNVAAFTKSLEESLFVDAGISGRGHRRNILNDTFNEVGVGIRTGLYSIYNSVMATQDYGKSGSAMYLTGVAFADTVSADGYYNPGEGLANISIVAIRDGNGQSYSTTTWTSGGYRLELPKGRYSIWATGAALGASQFIPSMNIGTMNMKRDFRVGMIRIAPEIAVIANGRYIPNNDSTPRVVDNTDFGSTNVAVGTITKTFAVANIGNGALSLTGSPRVVVTGVNAFDFVVTMQPNASLADESTCDFTVQFDPSGSGLRTAVISIASNDGNENPFTFTIVGNGTQTAMMAQPPSTNPGSSYSVPSSGWMSVGNTMSSLPEFAGTVSVDSASRAAQVFDEVDFGQYGELVSLAPIMSSGSSQLVGLCVDLSRVI